jgi:hypothetical protein
MNSPILTHLFLKKSHNIVSLFDKVNKFNKFCSNLEAQSLIDPLRYAPEKYLGDGFEFFVELFLKLHPCDNRIGIYNYVPIQTNDNGVDGKGVNILNEPSVAQVKYRTDKMEVLTATKDHLANLFSDGMLTYNVVSDNVNPKNYRHFVFTSASGLHFYTDNEMFKNKVKCFGYNDFRNFLDGNTVFWNLLREVIQYNLQKSN